MDARQSRRGKRISLRQEKMAAADLGGRTQAASGASKFSGGGDVRVMGKTRVECKYTENDSYTLKFSELEKLRKQAIKALEYPVLQFAFRVPSGQLEQYAVIQWDETEWPQVDWSTEAKSFILRKPTLSSAMHLGLTRIAFHVKEGNSLRSRYYRIMPWDDFVERHNANA